MNPDLDPSPEEAGVQAFRQLSHSMDRVGIVMKATETTQRSLLGDLQRAATQARDAASQALRASQTALEASRGARWPIAAWTALGVLLGLLGGIAGGYLLGHSSGWQAGRTAGYAEARDEQAAQHWANSPGGRTARALETAGSLTQLATCSAPGWQVTTQDGRRVCTVTPIRGSTYGWFLPDR